MSEDADKPAGPESEEPWQRARRLRLAQIEAEQAHGQQLAERYGRSDFRPRFAVLGHGHGKRRRR
jgi:hypothetical protein